MKDRLQNLIRTEQLSASKFADRIGVQRSSISHILSGRNNPSMDFIQRVLKVFPHVNSDWLLLGKGEMYNTIMQPTIFEVSAQNNDPNSTKSEVKDADNKLVNDEKRSSLPHKDSNSFTQHKDEEKILNSQEDNIVQRKPEKEIHKIVIFYKDRTFIEYFPE